MSGCPPHGPLTWGHFVINAKTGEKVSVRTCLACGEEVREVIDDA